jgi:hypothetical protein
MLRKLITHIVIAHNVRGYNMSDHLDLSGVWAARLELRLKASAPEYAKGFRGGFTTILVRCETAEEFIIAASKHVDREGFEIVGLERLYPLAYGEFEINESLKELVELTRDHPVQWTTFHIFKGDA